MPEDKSPQNNNGNVNGRAKVHVHKPYDPRAVVSLMSDDTGLVRLVRADGTTQPLFRIKEKSILVWDKLTKTECLIPAIRIGNMVIIDLSPNPSIDPIFEAAMFPAAPGTVKE